MVEDIDTESAEDDAFSDKLTTEDGGSSRRIEKKSIKWMEHKERRTAFTKIETLEGRRSLNIRPEPLVFG